MKTKALAAAFVTTALWSGSYIVNKAAFAQGIGPFTLAGMRYLLAGGVLCLLLKPSEQGKPLPFGYALLQGLVCYGLGQGCQYLGQSLMNPTMTSLLLNSSMVLFIVAADKIQLRENTRPGLWWKIMLLVGGMLLYYQPWKGMTALPAAGVVAILMAGFGSAMNVIANRYMLSKKGIEPRTLTLRPMLCGGAMMLTLGLMTEEMPAFNGQLVLCIAYLALISGAMGFGLWVWSQQYLTAVESGCINNIMIVEIAILDVLFFARKFGLWQWSGVVLIFAAVTLVQLRNGMAAKRPETR